MNNFDQNRTEQNRTEKEEVQFQLDNVAGWISIENYEAALIKARGLVEALEKINHQQ